MWGALLDPCRAGLAWAHSPLSRDKGRCGPRPAWGWGQAPQGRTGTGRRLLVLGCGDRDAAPGKEREARPPPAGYTALRPFPGSLELGPRPQRPADPGTLSPRVSLVFFLFETNTGPQGWAWRQSSLGPHGAQVSLLQGGRGTATDAAGAAQAVSFGGLVGFELGCHGVTRAACLGHCYETRDGRWTRPCPLPTGLTPAACAPISPGSRVARPPLPSPGLRARHLPAPESPVRHSCDGRGEVYCGFKTRLEGTAGRGWRRLPCNILATVRVL